jgi:hypothetical protein
MKAHSRDGFQARFRDHKVVKDVNTRHYCINKGLGILGNQIGPQIGSRLATVSADLVTSRDALDC